MLDIDWMSECVSVSSPIHVTL